MTRKKLITIAVAVIFAVSMVIGGGTLAYLTGGSVGLTNQSSQNFNWVSISETGASDDGTGSGNLVNSSYEIVPGTSQDKDPTVSVSYSLDSYVFITIEDTTGGEIFEFDVDPDYWTLLTSTTDSEGVITYVYYHLCEEGESGSTSAETNGVTYYKNSYPVLEDNSISYLSSVDNETLVAEFSETGDPTFYDDVDYKLIFQAYIVQADVVGDDGVNDDPTTCWQVVAGAQGLGYAAVGATLYQTVEEAILDLEEGGTVTLLANATVSEGIAYSAEVPTVYTIDLNGYTMTIDNAQMQLSAVENEYVTAANLASYQSQYGNWIYEGYLISTTTVPTEVTIENGTIECVGTSGNMRFESGTTLTLNDVEFVSGSGSFVKAIQYYVSDNTTTNTITVSNSTFDNTYIDICGSSSYRPYEVTATFTDCDFSATPGNGGGCVTFDSYIYGDITFTDCNFEVTGGGNANGAIVINSSSSYCADGSVNLVLNNNTITCTSTGTYVWNTYTPCPVRISNTSVVNVTDNKASAYSYTLDGEPVTYDGQAITVVTAAEVTSGDGSTELEAALSSAATAATSTGEVVVELGEGSYNLTGTTTTIASGVTINGSGTDETTLTVDCSSTGDGYTISTENVTLSNLTISCENMGTGYGDSAINVTASGVVLDNVVITGGTQNTYTASIYINGGSDSDFTFTIMNSTIDNSSKAPFRALFVEGLAGTLYIENCTIDAVYPLNVMSASTTAEVYFTDCTLHGWTSYTANVNKVVFTNCEFSKGDGRNTYDCIASYTDTYLIDCTFDDSFALYAQTTGFSWYLTNCTKAGTAVTADNFKTLFSDSDVLNKSTCIVDGTTVEADSN